jgi:hypothetical protein
MFYMCCTSHLHNFIILVIFWVECKLWSPSYGIFSSLLSVLPGLSLCSWLNGRDHVSKPYKTAAKIIIIIHLLGCYCLFCRFLFVFSCVVLLPLLFVSSSLGHWPLAVQLSTYINKELNWIIIITILHFSFTSWTENKMTKCSALNDRRQT